jgi:serine/threonine-protein kinase
LSPESRFIPGTILAKRYRIVGLLGRGGMGEVYRADDLKLGQPVALKFLPAAVERDQARLDRFLNEVKTALKVSHPNVCRVHDIGEVDGQHYLSMEYVDGEDLASLLRRIERLPQNKAVQIARQLCAGLGAAHEQGILHRDLKPANVMIDGRGRAKITDFGLAGLAEGIEGDEVRAGTPQYMSPEQHTGKEVTIRSDIYSLGLVLYELFTGKRAFEAASPAEIRKLQEESSPTSPSSHVEGLDQTVERIILRCLESDPGQRPVSALAVAAALPGGDPLAAALAAGETPSPAMVADAGGEGALRPAIAVSLLVVVILGLLGGALLAEKTPEGQGLLGYAPMNKPPATLAEDARRILRSLGHDGPVADTAHGFRVDYGYLGYVEENDSSPDRWDRLASGQPPAIFFWYRESPRLLVPRRRGTEIVTQHDPMEHYSGEVNIDLDTEGRLRWLRVVPPQRDETLGTDPQTDWTALFSAAGLDPAAFTPVEPVWIPWNYCDQRMAWEGSYASDPNIPIRIEAGSYRGRVMAFEIVEPWDQAWRQEERESQPGITAANILFGVILLSVVVGAALLAIRNLRLGRGDRKGAFRLAAFVTIGYLAASILGASHVPDFMEELGLITESMTSAVLIGGLMWMLYVALEPFLRKRWPEALISWNRLLAGRFRDPIIGRDILAGATAAIAYLAVIAPLTSVPRWLGWTTSAPEVQGGILRLLGPRFALMKIIDNSWSSLIFAMVILLVLLLLRILVRKHWIALVGLLALFTAVVVLQYIAKPDQILFQLPALWLTIGSIFFLVSRFGLLSVWAYLLCAMLIVACSGSVTVWYGGNLLFFYIAIAALATYGCWISLAGRPLFREGLVPEK